MSRLRPNPGPPKVFAIAARADGELVVGTVGRGVRLSASRWRDWVEPHAGASGVHAITTAPDGRLLAGTVGCGVMASADGGDSWDAVGVGLEDATVSSGLPLVRYINQGRAEGDRPHLSPRQTARILLTRPDRLTAGLRCPEHSGQSIQ